jgi:hypothetical protein
MRSPSVRSRRSKAARTDEIGDGKIFVTTLTGGPRTGESGEANLNDRRGGIRPNVDAERLSRFRGQGQRDRPGGGGDHRRRVRPVVDSLVKDIIMPVVGKLVGGLDF